MDHPKIPPLAYSQQHQQHQTQHQHHQQRQHMHQQHHHHQQQHQHQQQQQQRHEPQHQHQQHQQQQLQDLEDQKENRPSLTRLLHALDLVLHLQSTGKVESSPAQAHAYPQRRVSDFYDLQSELGRGHYGVVRTCVDRTSRRTFACKSIMASSISKPEDVRELCAEVMNMVHLQQYCSRPQDAVQLHDLFQDETGFHLIMDYCRGGDLFDHVTRHKRLAEKEAAQVLCQLAQAVLAMHRCGLVHRDLKPENILLADSPKEWGGSWKLKVADFGLCVQLGPDQWAKGVAGSPFYMAPEVITGQFYGPEVDVWSLGVIAYTCLSGTLPFFGKSHDDIFSAVCQAPLDFSRKPWPNVSYDAKSLICLMLDRDPARRVSLETVLEHPWLLRHCPELTEKKAAFGSPMRLSRVLQSFCKSNCPSKDSAEAQPTPTRCPSQTMVSESVAMACTLPHHVQSPYAASPMDDAHEESEASNMDVDSTATSQFSFVVALTPTGSAASSAASNVASGHEEGTALVVEKPAKVKVELAKHRVPAGSRKGFSAPLTPKPRHAHK